MTDDKREEYERLRTQKAELEHQQRTLLFRAKVLEIEIRDLRQTLAVIDELIREKVAAGQLSRDVAGDKAYYEVATRCGYF